MSSTKHNRNNTTVGALISIALLIVISVAGFTYREQLQAAFATAPSQEAAVGLSRNPRSIVEIKTNYTDTERTVRVLIVPGHEPTYGGAEYQKLKERDMTLELGLYLQKILESNDRYTVFIARDEKGWTPVFKEYFQNEWPEIIAWMTESREDFSRLIAIGAVSEPYSPLNHNKAPEDVATRLYGINKWSNENDMDIVLHLHFNDHPRPKVRLPGTYTGVSLYVPAAQYGNSTTSRAVADRIFDRLTKYNAVSNLPGENEGIIDTPELIAIGSNDTSDAVSVLIEYGYIYEPQFQTKKVRSLAIKDLALQTYLGLQDFFDPDAMAQLDASYDTMLLPYAPTKPVTNNKTLAPDIFALQTALMFDAVYPPDGKDKHDCPRTGTLGACTKEALHAFQDKYGISGETGVVGRKTLEMLRGL